ncbi:uncharacterized protein TNCV_2547901 [Trichonephila clavipes]|nr:uncharacterized protein TNCV_2547901 [Trichonephila clavipes]
MTSSCDLFMNDVIALLIGGRTGGQTAVEIEPLIERLNSTNYNTWKESVRVLLMDRNSRRIITDQEVTPDDDASAKENWNFESRWDRAYSTIYLSVEKEYRNLILDTCDPIVAWKNFRIIFSHILVHALLDYWMNFLTRT